MKTRKDYMDNKISHDEYYSQFVNDGVKQAVLNHIGKDRLLKSKDEHLNDIPIKLWDELTGFSFRGGEMVAKPHTIEPIKASKLKEAGDGISPAGLVCIYKQAGYHLIKEFKS
jgi:hypothetical protein